MNVEFLEIADDDPARVLIVGQIARISTGLLEWREHLTIGLLVALAQIDILSLLFDQNAGRLDQTVNKAGMAQLYAHLKFDIFIRLSYAEHLLQKRHPERLCFLLFVATAFPVSRKFLRSRSLFHIRHGCALLQCPS